MGMPSALITAVGDSPLSQHAVARLESEGVDLGAVLRVQGPPALALVTTDAEGHPAYDFRLEGTPEADGLSKAAAKVCRHP